MNAGDTFVLADSSVDNHLWLVLSDPVLDPEHVLIVNLTTHTPDKETACILQTGDHPFIRHETCVHYRESRIVPDAQLDRLKSAALLQPNEAVTGELLARVREGAARSQWIPEGNLKLLVDQGLVEDV